MERQRIDYVIHLSDSISEDEIGVPGEKSNAQDSSYSSRRDPQRAGDLAGELDCRGWGA